MDGVKFVINSPPSQWAGREYTIKQEGDHYFVEWASGRVDYTLEELEQAFESGFFIKIYE